MVRERKIPFEISSPADTTRSDAISAFLEMRKIAEVNDYFHKYGIYADRLSTREDLPDPKDLVFYEVCMAKREEGSMLVTGNMKHFPVKPFIVTPNELLEIISR